MRHWFERLAWRLAGFKAPHKVRRTSSIKVFPNPIELNPRKGCAIVVLSPHLDDEAIAMGGSISRFLRDGCQVHVFYITNGDKGGVPEERRGESDEFGRLCKERAGGTLRQYYLGSPEGEVDVKKTVTELCDVIAGINPEFVFTPCGNDNHKDHLDTHRVLLGLKDGLPSAVCLGYELWSTIEHPYAFMDITEFTGAKKEMIQVYESQTRHKDYAAIILALNKYRGGILIADGRYAEAFERI